MPILTSPPPELSALGFKITIMSSRDRSAVFPLLIDIALSFDGAILGVTLALGAVRAAFKYASTSAALKKIKDAPEVSVSDLRSLIRASDDQSETSDDQERIVVVRGTVKAKVTGGEGSNKKKNNVLTSQETGDKALIIHRSQTVRNTYTYNIVLTNFSFILPNILGKMLGLRNNDH